MISEILTKLCFDLWSFSRRTIISHFLLSGGIFIQCYCREVLLKFKCYIKSTVTVLTAQYRRQRFRYVFAHLIFFNFLSLFVRSRTNKCIVSASFIKAEITIPKCIPVVRRIYLLLITCDSCRNKSCALQAANLSSRRS